MSTLPVLVFLLLCFLPGYCSFLTMMVSPTAPTQPRRSRRLQSMEPEGTLMAEEPTTKKKKTSRQKEEGAKNKLTVKNKKARQSLPRTIEKSIMTNNTDIHHVFGVDEAGRGPLAGPVVAAAIRLPMDCSIDGVTDSKRLTKETHREELYHAITTATSDWAVAVIDAATIDDVNILQATLLGMRLATRVVMQLDVQDITIHDAASIHHEEACYVICSPQLQSDAATKGPSSCFALIDGNKVPSDMPCGAQAVVKGDGREYSIAAASVLAKVTRDRLMRSYHQVYDQYGLDQHKGYPTAAHIRALQRYGATKIHRRTFAPLKHWKEDSRIEQDP